MWNLVLSIQIYCNKWLWTWLSLSNPAFVGAQSCVISVTHNLSFIVAIWNWFCHLYQSEVVQESNLMQLFAYLLRCCSRSRLGCWATWPHLQSLLVQVLVRALVPVHLVVLVRFEVLVFSEVLVPEFLASNLWMKFLAFLVYILVHPSGRS